MVFPPINHELLIWLVERLVHHRKNADDLRIPEFSMELRGELAKRLQTQQAVEIVEVAARFGFYGDARQIKADRVQLRNSLRKKGLAPRKGKRPTYGLPELVSEIGPLLVHFGIRFGSGENSSLVVMLRRIACEMRVTGDPRDELRRLRRLAGARRKRLHAAIIDAVAKGLAPLKVNPP